MSKGLSPLSARYTVASDKEQTVNLHIEGSTFPNWDGQDQKRVWTVKGDELKVTNPTASVGGVELRRLETGQVVDCGGHRPPYKCLKSRHQALTNA